jgi:putative FmdB family regulatory protein
MPIYEYACSACGHEFEEWQKMSDPPVRTCPKCKKKKVERLISQTAFQLKGGGWYADLYSSSKPGKAGSSEGAGEKGSGDKAAAGEGSKDSGSKDATSAKSDSKASTKSDSKSGKSAESSSKKESKTASKKSETRAA